MEVIFKRNIEIAGSQERERERERIRDEVSLVFVWLSVCFKLVPNLGFRMKRKKLILFAIKLTHVFESLSAVVQAVLTHGQSEHCGRGKGKSEHDDRLHGKA